jgi:hypothetical protein
MGTVKIVDNFLEKNLINFLHDYFLKIPHYYGQTSIKGDIGFYYHNFDVNNPLINFLCTILDKNIKILRVYLNIQYNNMDGDFHIDDGDTTYLIMVSKTLQKNSGEFQFIENNKINSIEFIQNRMIKFPASIMHKGLAPTEKNFHRITLAFKTEKL